MRKILLFIAATLVMYYSFAQLEVIDAENITRERWRDSMLRMDNAHEACLQVVTYNIS